MVEMFYFKVWLELFDYDLFDGLWCCFFNFSVVFGWELVEGCKVLYEEISFCDEEYWYLRDIIKMSLMLF